MKPTRLQQPCVTRNITAGKFHDELPMITYLQGKVIHHSETSMEILCGSVGYHVEVPPGLQSTEDIALFITTEWRDDGPHLYGFLTREEKNGFQSLRTIKGIGGRLALHILAHYDLASLADVIASKNHEALVSIPGVGKKLAQRLIHECPDLAINRIQVSSASSAQQNAAHALAALGYTNHAIQQAQQTLAEEAHETWDTQMWIKQTLQLLAAELVRRSQT